MTNLEQVKDTVRKLLNLARNDAATDGEINNALKFAQRMMSEHHLSEDDLGQEPEDQYEAIDQAECGQTFTSVGRKIYLWESQLARFCAAFVGGVKYYASHSQSVQRSAAGIATANGDYGKRFCFYGLSDEARLAGELFDDLRLTIITMGKLKFGGCYRGDGGMYSEGFVDGLFDRMYAERESERKEAKKLVEQSGQSTALVLVERRADLVQRKEQRATDWLTKDKGITLVSGSRRSGAYGSSSARSEGMADGRKANPSVTRAKRLTAS